MVLFQYLQNILISMSTMFGISKLSKKYQGTIGSFFTIIFLFILAKYNFYINFLTFAILTIMSLISIKLYLKKFYPIAEDKPKSNNPLANLFAMMQSKNKLLANYDDNIKAKKLDPQEIIIDEFLGQIIAFVPLSSIYLFENYICNNSTILLNATLSFLLFRFFDSIKPFPVNHIDDNSNGPFGIVFDDIAAGILALITKNAIYIIVAKFFINA
ncbi:MAG: phosphatidylglycerophosphatase A [Rickettsiales bacterium]